MAIVRKLEAIHLSKKSSHTEVSGTYTIITEDNGEKYLQVDTYGSAEREKSGIKSQSIRFSPDAIIQLKSIIDKL